MLDRHPARPGLGADQPRVLRDVLASRSRRERSTTKGVPGTGGGVIDVLIFVVACSCVMELLVGKR